ncbi:hypothetical protein [Beduinella massiliensis]|uniref:hypothetical protein n=1 Tax=Beduinella massiliensis TaxID=1852363 RepID=UPI000C863367
MQSKKRSAVEEAERKREERERQEAQSREAQSREARERALRGETNGSKADLSRSLAEHEERRRAETQEKLRAGGDSAMQVLHGISDPEKRSRALELYTNATRDKQSSLYNPNQTLTYKQGLSALEKLDKQAAQTKAENQRALNDLQVERNEAKLNRLAKNAIREDDKLLYELNTRLRSSTDKGVVGKLRRGQEFTAAGLDSLAVERMIQGIPDEQKRREAADIYTRLQKYEGSPLYREFGRTSASTLNKPTEDAELYAEYGGQSYIVPATPKAEEDQGKAEKGMIEGLAEKWLEITGGSPDYAAGPTPGETAGQQDTKEADAPATAMRVVAASGEEQVMATPGEATSGEAQVTTGKMYDTPAGPPAPETNAAEKSTTGFADSSDARALKKVDEEIADIERQIATLDRQIAEQPGAFGESLEPVRAQLVLSLTQRQSERLSLLDAAGTVTDEEALIYYKRGQLDELSPEQQRMAQTFAENNELLLERENYFVTGMRESHLGESAMDVLALTDSEYLTDQERGEVLLGMADDLQAAKAGGYANLGAYYGANPAAKKRYGEYVIREAGVRAEMDAQREHEQATARAQLDRMVGVALTNDALGQTTDADRNVLRYLDSIDVFEDQEPLFYNLYAGVDEQLQNEILYGDLAGGDYDYMTMVDYARDALRREKQYAAALGMTLETFWAGHPERARTAADYVSYATARYDTLWNEPIARAVASGEITDDSYKIARFFMGDEQVDALIAQGGEGVGMWSAAGLGMKAGTLDFAAGVVGAGVGLVEKPADKLVTNNAQDYTMFYGSGARAALRADLLKIAYGQPDEAERDRMLHLIAKTPDIFDVPIDTRAHFNLLKNARTNLTQSAADVKRFADEHMTVNERLLFDTSANITTNVESLTGGALVTALSGSPTLGLAIGYGLPEYGNDYYDYMAATGGDVNKSKWGASLSFAATMATESIPFERYTGMIFGSGVTAGAGRIAQDQGAKGLKSVLLTSAHIAKELGGNTLIEAGQEYLEGTINDSIQQMLVDGDLNLLQAHQVGVEGSKASLLTSPALFFLSSTSGKIGDTVRKYVKAADGGPIDVAALVTELNELSPAARQEEADTIKKDAVRNRADALTAEQVAAGALNTPEAQAQADSANMALSEAQAEKNAADTALAGAQEQKVTAVDAVAVAQGAELKAASKELQAAAQAAASASARATVANKAYAEKKAASDAANRALEDAQLNTLDAIRAESLQQAQKEYGEAAGAYVPGFTLADATDAQLEAAAEKAASGSVASAQKQFDQANRSAARLTESLAGLTESAGRAQARYDEAAAAYSRDPSRENRIVLEQSKKQYKNALTRLQRTQGNLLHARERVTTTQAALAAETARMQAETAVLSGVMRDARDAIAALPAEQQQAMRKAWQENVKAYGTAEGTARTLEAALELRAAAEQVKAQAKADAEADTADVETVFAGRSLRDPVVQRFVSDVAQRTGTLIEFAQLAAGDEGYYDRTRGVLVLSDALDGAAAVKAVAIHELTHTIEGTQSYAGFAEAALNAAYGGDNAAVQEAIDAKRAQYEAFGRTLDDVSARAEVVAEAARRVVYASEADIDRLVRSNRSLAQRIYDAIRDFISGLGRRRSDPQYADIRRAQRLFEKALNEKAPAQSGGEQHSIEQDDRGYYVKADRKVVLSDNPKLWNDEIQRYIQDTIRKNGDVTIQTLDGDTLRITEKSQWHAGSRNKGQSDALYKTKLNASAHLDEVAFVSTDLGKERPNSPDKNGRHGKLAALGWRYRQAYFEDYDGQRYEMTISTAQNEEGQTVYNIGRVKKIENHPTSVRGPVRGEIPPHVPTDANASIIRSDGNNSITESAPAVNTQSTQKAPNDAQHSLGQRQFGSQTAQTLEDIPASIRRGLAENSGYGTDTNDAQIVRAYNAYQEMGAEAAAAEVLSREGALSADDVALAQVTVAHAIQDGELLLAAQLLDRYNREGTQLGQALQARKIMSRLTVQGALAETTKRVEGYNRKALSGMHEKSRKADIKRTVERVTTALPAGPEIKTDGGNNRWHVPLNDAQRALIREYGLEGVSLPGIHYNRATVEQRMLAAIIATPGLPRGGEHLNLIEQLEYMRRGYAVTTEADLNYIASQMQEFMNQSQAAGEADADFDAVTSREARLALARAYEAAGNTMPVHMGEKGTGLLYMNMLQRYVTAIKNVLSNVFTRPLELTSTAVASLVDQAVARETGERTTGLATRAEARAARRAFAQEVANTWADYFVDKADTSHSAKYAVGARGRTYQTEWLEAAKALVDFSMQIGDRPFYEQCYAEELAVLRRLNPALDVKTARQEATARALERVFQEDNAVTAGLSRIAQGKFGFAVKLLVPFAKTPTNVVTRMAQYSPVGLIDALLRKGWYASRSRNGEFNQRDFVMGVGRGLTGTGLMLAGMLLGAGGVLRFGSGDEDDKDKAALMQANGVPYSAYIVDWNGNQHEIEWALPMAGPLVLGASFSKRIENDEALWAATIGGLCDMGDQLFDSSFMQSLTSVLRGNSESPAVNISTGLASSAMGMLVPGNLRAIAKTIDPYVRDTSAENEWQKAFNQSVVAAIPGWRQTLPVKVDVTGQPMSQNAAYSGVAHFLDSFLAPTATLAPRNDPALAELLEIAGRTSDGSWLPGNPLYGAKYSLTVPKTYAKSLRLNQGEDSYSCTLTPEERAAYNMDFGRLLFDGGTTIDNKGKRVIVPGLRETLESRKWAKMDDLERIELVKEMSSICKAGVTYEWAKQKHKEAGQ